MKIRSSTTADADTGLPFRAKEVSWLAFNSRVLQEAGDSSVPLLERLKFLGIYSSNLDEFFRVRVATLKRLAKLGKRYRQVGIPDPVGTLETINDIVLQESRLFNETYARIIAGLRKAGIRLIDETKIPRDLRPWVTDYFERRVKPRLMPVMVKASFRLSGLRDQPMYLAVQLRKKHGKGRPTYALIEIPGRELGRFVVLPDHGGDTLVMYLDDIIRFGLPSLFASLPYDDFESYAIKFTRDAELAFDDDITESFLAKVTDGLRAREQGNPVRLNYDSRIPPHFLRLFVKKLGITGDDTLFPGARYHNRKDLMSFPMLGGEELRLADSSPVRHAGLQGKGRERSLFKAIRKKDHLLHFPYHSFGVFLDLLREACMDPRVKTIQMTQYRLANRSAVANALVNAVRAGKQVGVLVEPTARFDEEANIHWANLYQAAGIHVVLGVPGLKVHSKLCLISRNEGSGQRYYTVVGTGNFNEDTARLYTDHMLFTADPDIGMDAARIFQYFNHSYRPPKLKKLIVAPFQLRQKIASLIEREIDYAKAGRKASISIKINNFSDPDTVLLLYRASQAGVKVRIICRSMFSLVTGDPDLSANIEAIGIVDSLLEHSRVLRFSNGGQPEYFLCSADFLPRNFDSRVETLCPVEAKDLQAELDTYLRLQWRDSKKARLLDAELSNQRYVPHKGKAQGASQAAIRAWLSGVLRE
jgi:polyphosphate kinase